MFDQNFQNLLAQSGRWLNALFSGAVLLQLAAFGLLLIVAWLLHFLLRRLLFAFESQFVQISWARPIFGSIRRVLLPVTALLLSQLVTNTFRASGWADTLLVRWFIPLLGLWLVYNLVTMLLSFSMTAGPARVWRTQIILPLLLLAWVLGGLGLLDNIFQWGPAWGGNQRITVGSVMTGLVVIVLFSLLARGAGQFLERTFLPQAGAEPALAHAASALVTYTVVTIGVITALTMTGFDLTTLTVIIGGLSVGLGFGLQQIVNNFVSGFILMFDRSIGPGDIIEVGTTRGTVQSIGIRSMIVKTPDNIELIIPNSRFLSETMVNLTRTDPLVRVRINISVAHTANPRQVEQALLAVAQHPDLLADPPPSVQFQGFGNDGLNFDLLVWTREPARIAMLTSDLRYSIWETLAAHKIEIALPQPDIHLHLDESKPDKQPAHE